jgi:hypothetical protein
VSRQSRRATSWGLARHHPGHRRLHESEHTKGAAIDARSDVFSPAPCSTSSRRTASIRGSTTIEMLRRSLRRSGPGRLRACSSDSSASAIPRPSGRRYASLADFARSRRRHEARRLAENRHNPVRHPLHRTRRDLRLTEPRNSRLVTITRASGSGRRGSRWRPRGARRIRQWVQQALDRVDPSLCLGHRRGVRDRGPGRGTVLGDSRPSSPDLLLVLTAASMWSTRSRASQTLLASTSSSA